MTDSKKAIEAFMGGMGTEPLPKEMVDQAYAGHLAGPSTQDRIAMFEVLTAALLAQTKNVTLEEYVGPEAAKDPQLIEMHELLNEALRDLTMEYARGLLPGFPDDKGWLMNLMPHLRPRMAQLMERKKKQ